MWEPERVAGHGQGEHTHSGSLPRKNEPQVSRSEFSGVLTPALCLPSLTAVERLEEEPCTQVVTPVLTHFPTGEVGGSEIRAKQEEKSAA